MGKMYMKKKSRIYRLLGVAAVVVLAVCGMVMIIPQLGNVVSKPDDGLTSQEATEAANQAEKETNVLIKMDSLPYEEEKLPFQSSDENQTMSLCGISENRIFFYETKSNLGENGLDGTMIINYYEYDWITQTKTQLFEHEVRYGYEPVCYEDHLFVLSEILDSENNNYQLYDITAEEVSIISEGACLGVPVFTICGSDLLFKMEEQQEKGYTSCLKCYDIDTKEIEIIAKEELAGTNLEDMKGIMISTAGGWGEDIIYATYSLTYEDPDNVEMKMYSYNYSTKETKELPIDLGIYSAYVGGNEQCVIANFWTGEGEANSNIYLKNEQDYETYKIPNTTAMGDILYTQEMSNGLVFVRCDSGYTIVDLEQKTYSDERIVTPSFCYKNEVAYMDDQNVLHIRKYGDTAKALQ